MFSKMFGSTDKCENAEDNAFALENAELKLKVDALEKRLTVLERQIEQLLTEKKHFEQTEEIDEKQSEDKLQQAVIVSSAISPQSYFLPMPNADGTFPYASEKEEIGKSVYKMTKINSTKGTVSVLSSSDALATALISISQIIKPMCKITSSIPANPSKIITETEGKVTFNGSFWQITDKAIIRFQ